MRKFFSKATRQILTPSVFISGVFLLSVSFPIDGFAKDISQQDNLKPKITFFENMREHLRSIFPINNNQKASYPKEQEFFRFEQSGPDPESFSTNGMSVTESMDFAFANNMDVQLAQEEIELAQMKVNEALRAMLPAVSAQYEERNARLTDPYEGKSYHVELEQPVFYSGELKHAYRQARANLAIAQINLNRVRSDVMVDVITAYYGFLNEGFNLKYQKELLSFAEKDAALAEKEYERGIIPEIDMLNTLSLYNQVDYQYKLAQKDFALAEMNFQQALNVDAQNDKALAPEWNAGDNSRDLAELDFFVSLEQCLKTASSGHWELQLTQLAVESSSHARSVARSKGRPKFSFVGRYGQGAEAFDTDDLDLGDQWFLGGKMSWSFGGSTLDYSYGVEEIFPAISKVQSTEGITQTAKISLLDDLKYFSGKKESEIHYQEAVKKRQQTRRRIMSDVKEHYYNLEKAVIEMEAGRNEKNFREKQLAILERKRQAHEAAIADVLSARIDLARAGVSSINAVGNYYISLAQLNRAMGVKGFVGDYSDLKEMTMIRK